MAGTEVITDIDSKSEKQKLAEEKKRLKAEKKEQKKEAKRRAKEIALQEEQLGEDDLHCFLKLLPLYLQCILCFRYLNPLESDIVIHLYQCIPIVKDILNI